MSGNPKGGRKRARRDTMQGVTPAPANPGGYIDGATGQYRADGYVSPYTGFGYQGLDKRVGHTFVAEQISYREAIDLCRGNDMAKRAVETVPSECFRMGYEVSIADLANATELQELVERRIRELEVNRKVKEAYQHERKFGGGAILLGVNDGQPLSMPLNMNRVISFDYLTVLEPLELWPLYFYSDPAKPKYGEPSHYQLSATARGTSAPDNNGPQLTTGIIHESRLVVFPGVRVSKFQQESGTSGQHWGDGILTAFVEVLRDFQIACASVGIIMTDFSQLVISIKNFAGLISQDNGNGFLNRMRMMELVRSTARAVVVDAEEQVTRQSTSVAGLRELLDWLSSRLAAAVDMPLTLLMGQSPKGLGNEGDSDIRFFYDRIAGIQKDRLEPVITRIIQLVFRSLGTRKEPEKWNIKWRPLWQPSDKELAEARKTQAETDAIYVEKVGLRQYDVLKNRFGGGEYSFETNIDLSDYAEIDLSPSELAAFNREINGLPDPNDPEGGEGGPPKPGAPKKPAAEPDDDEEEPEEIDQNDSLEWMALALEELDEDIREDFNPNHGTGGRFASAPGGSGGGATEGGGGGGGSEGAGGGGSGPKTTITKRTVHEGTVHTEHGPKKMTTEKIEASHGIVDPRGRAVGGHATIRQVEGQHGYEVRVQVTRNGEKYGAIPVKSTTTHATKEEAHAAAERALHAQGARYQKAAGFNVAAKPAAAPATSPVAKPAKAKKPTEHNETGTLGPQKVAEGKRLSGKAWVLNHNTQALQDPANRTRAIGYHREAAQFHSSVGNHTMAGKHIEAAGKLERGE